MLSVLSLEIIVTLGRQRALVAPPEPSTFLGMYQAGFVEPMAKNALATPVQLQRSGKLPNLAPSAEGRGLAQPAYGMFAFVGEKRAPFSHGMRPSRKCQHSVT